MAIDLPTNLAPTTMTPSLISLRRDINPTFGGPDQRIQRLGSRWAFKVDMPPMTYIEAMPWIAALTRGEGDTVRLRLPQPGFDAGSPGNPLVNGASQLGTYLNVDGFGSYTAKAAQWFNLTIAGQKYLYQVAEDKVAEAGVMTALHFTPMIRRSPPDNSPVDFETPVVEGFLQGRETSWTMENAMDVGLSFTIQERE